jgi:hypothetical protein
MRDYGMSISKTGLEVIGFQIRVVREDGLRSFPVSKQAENEFDRDAHTANDGFATKNLGVHCYASKECLVDHGIVVFVVRRSEPFVSQDIVDSKTLVGHTSVSCPRGLGSRACGSSGTKDPPLRVGY